MNLDPVSQPSLHLAGLTPGSRLTTLSTATATIEVKNGTDVPIDIGRGGWQVFLELRNRHGELLETLDDLARSTMLYERVRDGAISKTLAPGEVFRLNLRLCQYHPPFAASGYLLNAACRGPDGTVARSQGVHYLHVTDVAIDAVTLWYENPVFGTQTLMCRGTVSESGVERTGVWLRWVSDGSASGSHRCDELVGHFDGAAPFPARAAFWQVEDLDEGLLKVMVQDFGEGRIAISRHLAGNMLEAPRKVRLATPVPLLPHAFRLQDGTVFVFGIDTGGELVGQAVAPDGSASICLRYTVDPQVPLAIEMGPDVIRLVRALPSLTQTVFDHDGEFVFEQVFQAADGHPVLLSVNLAQMVVRAAFASPQDRRRLRLVEVPLPLLDESVNAKQREIALPLRRGDEIRELDFLIDDKLGLVLAYSTASGRLLVRDAQGRLQRVHRQAARHFPKLLACGKESRTAYVGSSRPGIGFRFLPVGSGDLRSMFNIVRA